MKLDLDKYRKISAAAGREYVLKEDEKQRQEKEKIQSEKMEKQIAERTAEDKQYQDIINSIPEKIESFAKGGSNSCPVMDGTVRVPAKYIQWNRSNRTANLDMLPALEQKVFKYCKEAGLKPYIQSYNTTPHGYGLWSENHDTLSYMIIVQW